MQPIFNVLPNVLEETFGNTRVGGHCRATLKQTAPPEKIVKNKLQRYSLTHIQPTFATD